MTPDILSVLLKIVLPILAGGGGLKVLQLVRDIAKDRRDRPVEEQSSAIEITKELQAIARDSVAGVRAEMQTMRDQHATERAEDRRQLAQARQQLRDVTDRMETREREHTENEERSRSMMERMKNRIAQLVKVLTDNNLDVPEEVLTP